MEKPTFKLVGVPCGQHGQYTFYKALRLTIGDKEKIVAIGEFFFVRIWQDSELVSVGELQLLWTDRVSDQTLVSLRLYFLPENTPDGRGLHGKDEVLAINDKVVVRAEDLLSWVTDGADWRYGLRAVWRGACAPPAESKPSAPLHHTKLDFSDVDKEKSTIDDVDSPGVVVFSYPRYCRYRALIARLEGIEADWLRDSLVAALGGYAAATTNTRILYCKDTFEYPELEGHEFVCNELAPRLKGRPRGRRRRAEPASAAEPASPSSANTDQEDEVRVPRRLTLRNDKRSSDEESQGSAEDRAFLNQLRHFHRERGDNYPLRDLSLRSLYEQVAARGGYEAACRRRLWRGLRPALRRHYERYLLPFEKHQSRHNGAKFPNGRPPPPTVATIELRDTPPRDAPTPHYNDHEPRETKEELNLISKPAEVLNREFLESLPKADKLENSPKVEKYENSSKAEKYENSPKAERKVENSPKVLNKYENLPKLEKVEKHRDVTDGVVKKLFEDVKFGGEKERDDRVYANEVKNFSGNPEVTSKEGHTNSPLAALLAIDKSLSEANSQKNHRPAGKSSLRAVRVKPARPATVPVSTPTSGSSPAPVTNFGIHRPPAVHSDDDIQEVPYKPKTPEIIDLDEYPESPQSLKKKKLDILKERGLEVTAVPPWPLAPNQPLIPPAPMLINPSLQHQIVTQAQLFQMYNIIPQNYNNGLQPPKVIQGTGIYGSSGPEKTVYGNPKDPFMPPPHVLHGTPLKPTRTVSVTTPPHDILDLTCKISPIHKPTVEIVRVPSAPSPSKQNPQNPNNSQNPQNLTKNYTLMDGKAVVGSNLEITLVNHPKLTPNKSRPPQKRSSNGKFVSSKTPTPPKETPRAQPSPSSGKKNPLIVPNYQINSRDDVSPTSSTGSLPRGMEVPPEGVYGALYGLGFDARQLAAYRHALATQLAGYSSLLSMGATSGTPTTKN